MELTDKEKEHIKAEEIYRQEIIKSLRPKQNTKEKTWNFLNSSFCIFILSAIIVSFVSYNFERIQSINKEKRQNQIEISKLDLEIQSRLNQFGLHLKQWEQWLIYNDSWKTDSTYKHGYSALFLALNKNPEKNSYNNYTPIFEEFYKYSLPFLINELALRVESKVEKKQLYEVSNYLVTHVLFEYYSPSNFEANLKEFKKNILIDRWEKFWMFRECSEVNPLCLDRKTNSRKNQ